MNDELTLQNNTFVPTSTGLVIHGTPSFDEWELYGRKLEFVEGSIQWLIGDWLNYGERKWGEMYAQAVNETQINTWTHYKWVANKVELCTRVHNLSWSHHRHVAVLEPDKQKLWLQEAVNNGWNANELRYQIQSNTRLPISKDSRSLNITLHHGDMIEVLAFLPDVYDLVIADPPYGVTDIEWDQLDTENWIRAIIPHLAEEYNLFWFCSPQYAADIEMIFRLNDLPIQSRIIWHRRNMALGSHAKSKFVDSWEMIFHAGNRELNFPDYWSDAWFDVQTFAVPQTNFTDKKVHPTQKPEALIQRLVQFGSYKGDRILDPFAGSGTTGFVCPDDRDCVLIEREAEYIGIIEDRIGIRRSV